MISSLNITFPGLLQGGAVAVLLLVFLMIVKGQLVPKSAVERIIKEADARVLREQDISTIWKNAHDSRITEVVKLSEGLRDAIDGLETVEHLIRALRRSGEEGQYAPALDAQPREPR